MKFKGSFHRYKEMKGGRSGGTFAEWDFGIKDSKTVAWLGQGYTRLCGLMVRVPDSEVNEVRVMVAYNEGQFWSANTPGKSPLQMWEPAVKTNIDICKDVPASGVWRFWKP